MFVISDGCYTGEDVLCSMPVLQSESAKVSGSISVVSSEAQELRTEPTRPALSYVMSVNVLLHKSKNLFVLVFLANSGVWRMQPRHVFCSVLQR